MKKEILWAPWRMGYILGEKNKGCFLCNAFKAKDEKSHYVLFKNEIAMVVMNIYPYNNGHLMIAPKKHTGDLEKLKDEELAILMDLIKKSSKILKRVLKPHGFNIGINIGKVSGAGVDKHLHFHIVPRWMGDTNFMPVISDTKVIPQSLDELYSLLKREFLKEKK